ncbi:MAG: malto-oligosyltrehalose trehalohydrolase [Nitrospirae bacterium]|nr:malto-oligosyltrehalose trehalohydrolase [Nitrospirota bacterium]
MRIGADYRGGGYCEFTVWAPRAEQVALRLRAPAERTVAMKRDSRGYWKAAAADVPPGTRYAYRLDDLRERPDPASSFQPEGVHGPSQVVDHAAFVWEDGAWQGVPLEEMIMYEIHVGTFTPEGTFESAISRLGELGELGISAVELMPVAQFPGGRNWGYDGTYPFAVQNSYGGHEGLKRFVNECHRRGIAVILDVVYNHLGPEGNYLWDFGPYFTEKYRTPWGSALNFDDAYSNEVRNFFIENALSWFREYRVDALRIDAIHGITDMSAKPFLQELAEKTAEFSSSAGRKFYLIAESDLNDARVIRPAEAGGYGLDAQWNDDFHHSVHTLLTGEREGYYLDFGSAGRLAKCLREGFVYSGEYSEYRKRNHGNSSKDRPADQFIVFSQNHDQVGNRMLGERLSGLVSFEGCKLAAGAVLFSPYIPLLFMGEEYGEEAPFLYFVSHTDPALIDGVRNGRRQEFKAFAWKGELPDPQSEETFFRSKLAWENRGIGRHKVVCDFYRRLIAIRRSEAALAHPDRLGLEVKGFEDDKVLTMRRRKKESHVSCVLNFGGAVWNGGAFLPGGTWRKLLDSADARWGGPGSLVPEKVSGGAGVAVRGRSFVLFREEVDGK